MALRALPLRANPRPTVNCQLPIVNCLPVFLFLPLEGGFFFFFTLLSFVTFLSFPQLCRGVRKCSRKCSANLRQRPATKGWKCSPRCSPGEKRLTRSMVDYQLSVVKNIAAVSRNEPDFLNGYRLCSYQTTCSTERLPVCASKNPKQSVAPQFTSRDIQRDGKGNTFSCDFQANLQKCYYSVFIRAVEVYCRCAAACGRCARFFGRGGRWRCVPRRSGQEDFRPSDGDFFQPLGGVWEK